MSHSVGEQTTRRPRVAFVYARDDAVLGGGADARAGALREALGRVAAVDDLLLTATSRKRPRLRRVTEGLRGAAHGVPPRLSQQLDSRERKSILPRLLAADVIVASTTFSLPYVPRSLWARTVLDAHNIESRITSQLAKHDPQCWRRAAFRGTASWTRLWETAAARRLAQVWAVSDEEAAWFRAAGARDVVVVPNGVHLIAGRPTGGPDIVFVASFGSVFNQQAHTWFSSEVWPKVLATVPNARLVLAGRGSEELTGPNVSSLGYVLDLNDVYANARVAIAPLRSGAGTRLKILEGLAHGVPVVSTSIGAEGLALEADRDFVLADSPEAFASAVVRLLSDDAWHETLANQGATAVAENYGWEAIGANAMLSLLGLWETTP